MSTTKEPTVEVAESVLRAEIVTWGESNMELLENATKDLFAVEVLIIAVKETNMEVCDENVLLDLARDKLGDAQRRIEACHNELDVDREDAEIAQQQTADN